MSLTREQVRHVALLARLAVPDEQLDRVTGELVAILRYVEKLNELDTRDVEPLSHPAALSNVFRPDARTPSLPREEALRNAPRRRLGQFEVPRILH